MHHIHTDGNPSDSIDSIVDTLRQTILDVVGTVIDQSCQHPIPNKRMQEITLTAMKRLGQHLQTVTPDNAEKHAGAMVVSGIAAMITTQLHLRVIPGDPTQPSTN